MGKALLENSPTKKDLKGPDGQKAGREPAVCPCSPEGCIDRRVKAGRGRGLSSKRVSVGHGLT